MALSFAGDLALCFKHSKGLVPYVVHVGLVGALFLDQATPEDKDFLLDLVNRKPF